MQYVSLWPHANITSYLTFIMVGSEGWTFAYAGLSVKWCTQGHACRGSNTSSKPSCFTSSVCVCVCVFVFTRPGNLSGRKEGFPFASFEDRQHGASPDHVQDGLPRVPVATTTMGIAQSVASTSGLGLFRRSCSATSGWYWKQSALAS